MSTSKKEAKQKLDNTQRWSCHYCDDGTFEVLGDKNPKELLLMCATCGRVISVLPKNIDFDYLGPNKRLLEAKIESKTAIMKNRQMQIQLAKREIKKLKHINVKR